jgi:hypothetical protein
MTTGLPVVREKRYENKKPRALELPVVIFAII